MKAKANKLYRKASLAYYKYREIFVVVFCLMALLIFGLAVAEWFIDTFPVLALLSILGGILIWFIFIRRKLWE